MIATIGDTALIYPGSVLRVRWMRHQGSFPAKVVLTGYPEDFTRFLERVEEMGDTGSIALNSHGHPLKGPYRDLHQFNMELTRSWGFRIENVYVVLYAAKKEPNAKKQRRDYDKALDLRQDYLDGLEQ